MRYGSGASIHSPGRKRFKEERNAADKTLRRFGLFGNAGGIIATLSLIGTVIGSGSNRADSFTGVAFWVLVIFLFGLSAAALEVLTTELRSRAYLMQRGDRIPPRFGWLSFAKDLFKWIALVFLVAGTVLGLISLYDITQPLH